MSNVEANQIFNYYEIYSLNRGENRNNLLIQLRKKQREIKKKLSAGALNESIMKDLVEQDDLIARAIRDFKTDERFEKYNKKLDEAINNGKINVKVEQEAKDALERIERLFVKGAYERVIDLSIDVLQQYGAQVKIYNYLVQSYLFMDMNEEAYSMVRNYIDAFPYDEHALDLGVRYAVKIKGDLDAAQNYLNRLMEIQSDLIIAKVDKIFMFLARWDVDNAFKSIDKLIKNNKNPQVARTLASDLIGFANAMYKEGEHDGIKYNYLMSSKDYKYCRLLANKAYKICRDSDVKQFCRYTNHLGQSEFVPDNKLDLVIMLIVSAFVGYGLIQTCSSGKQLLKLKEILLSISFFILPTILLICTSWKPYWKIYKYLVTDERDTLETVAIWSCRLTTWMFRLVFLLLGVFFGGFGDDEG